MTEQTQISSATISAFRIAQTSEPSNPASAFSSMSGQVPLADPAHNGARTGVSIVLHAARLP
jgi:hypothetical protein